MSEGTRAGLVGTWELVDFVVRCSDGRPPRHPFGTAPRGRILYSADGFMSAVLSRQDRGEASTGRLETAHRASQAARAAAYDSYLSYSGRWELQGDHVHHHVDLALVPGVVGTTQVRRVERGADGLLTLRYSLPDRHGNTHHFALRWRRAQPGGPDARPGLV